MQCARQEQTVADFVKQKKNVNDLLNQSSKDKTWYIIDVRWWNRWSNFVDALTNDESLDVASDDYPGEVDNSALLSLGKLKPDLLHDADFTLLPEDVWNIFVNFYGCSHKDSSIFKRSAILHASGRMKVEIYPPTFQFISMDTYKMSFEATFSECQTIGEVKDSVRQFLKVDKTENIQLFIRDGIMNEEFEDDTLTIGEASLERQKFLYYKWRIANGVSYDSTRPGEATSSAPWHSLLSRPTSIVRKKPGMCGLSNLGNTCFMNSAIQCMSNVPELTDYFLKGTWEGDVNKYNPLGSQGRIARTYAELINHMWSGLYSYDAPRALKREIAGIATQFCGYAQHDSHELLVFLMDGIHEDLNRVKDKPYIEVKDSDGRPDEVVAAEAWRNYLARNDSTVVDLFHGQLKSTVICPTCNYRSITFDPFASLNLPLPDVSQFLKVVYIWPWVGNNTDRRPNSKQVNEQICGLIRCEIPLPSTFYVRDLLTELERERPPYSGCQYHLAEVYNNSLSKPWHPEHLVRDRNGSLLFAYELPQGILFPVRLRDSRLFNTSGWVGVPFYISIPKPVEQQEVSEDTVLRAIADRIRAAGFRQSGGTLEAAASGSRMEEMDSDQHGRNSACNNGFDSSPVVGSTGGGGVQKTGMNGDDECPLMHWLRGNVFCTYEYNVKQVRLSETGRIDLRPVYGPSRLFIDCAGSTLHAESDRLMRSIGFMSVDTPYIGQKSAIKLANCIQGFVSVEKLGARDLWYCSKCEDHKQATKHFELWSLPRIIVIQLKRFRSTIRMRDKIDTLVEFPIRGLDLTSFVANPACRDRFVYDLIAVSNHMGGLGGGHYTAYALNDATQRWCNFDDSTVTEIDESKIMTRSAYVLVYRRRETNQSNSLRNGTNEPTVYGVSAPKSVPADLDGVMDDELSDSFTSESSDQFLRLE